MKSAQLLSKLDRLNYPERQRTLVRVVRETDVPQLLQLLDSLKDDLYQAQCALTMASVAGQADFLVQALQWPWPQARLRAGRLLVALPGVPAGLADGVCGLDLTARLAFLRSVRRRGREDMAAILIGPIEERFGPKEAGLLFPALPPELWDDWLPRLSYGLSSWRTSAGRYPDRVLHHLRQELEKCTREWRESVWYRFASALEMLVEKRPGELLSLALELGRPRAIWSLLAPHWGSLASSEPRKVVELLQRVEYQIFWKSQGLPAGVLNRFRSFDKKTQLALAEPLADSEYHLQRLLCSVAPAERGELFQAATARLDLSQQRWSPAFMKALPHPERRREATRMLALPVVASTLETTIATLGLLSPEESTEQLKALVKNPKVEIRALVRKARVEGAGLYRDSLEEVLDELLTLKNESDPVRASALGALSYWPYGCLQEKHLSRLREMLQDVCQARDTSELTRGAFRRMALQWIELAGVEGPMFRFGLEVLKSLTDASAALYLGSIRNYSWERREAILEALLGRVDKEMKGENYNPLFALANSLGDRLWQHPVMEERLHTLTRSKIDWTSRRAIGYWLQHPEKRSQRVEELLKHDASSIAVTGVASILARQRQDLLDPFLRKKTIKGRFLSGETIYLLPVYSGFERWLPRQQKAFAELHALVFRDETKTLYTRATSLQMIDKLCFLSDELVRSFLDHPELALREAALGAMRTPEVLLDRLDSQEARVAAYRLVRVVRDRPPGEALEVVQQGLQRPNKLTAKKELYRLLGILRALEPLLEAWREEGQHRDLRLAVLHALQGMLDLAPVREIYQEALGDQDQWIVRAVLAAPRGVVPEEHRRQWVERLSALAEHPEPTLAGEIWTKLRGWAEEAPELTAETAGRGVSDLDSTSWRQAVELLLSCATAGGRPLYEATRRLVELDSVVREGRDLPARQRLRHLVNRASAEPDPQLRDHLLGEIAAVPLPESWLDFVVRASRESWVGLAVEVESFEEMEALIYAIKSEVGQAHWDPARILDAAGSLAAEESPAARRLAVELLTLAGAQLRWSAPCRGLLDKLRRDEYPGVAERAALVVTRAEP